MGGKIAATVVLQPGFLDAPHRPCEAGTDAVAIASNTLEFDSEPMIFLPSVIPQQQRSIAVDSDEHVDSPVIVEIAYGKAASGKRFCKDRASFGANVAELARLLTK